MNTNTATGPVRVPQPRMPADDTLARLLAPYTVAGLPRPRPTTRLRSRLYVARLWADIADLRSTTA